jgi:hypothetical protein
MSRDLASSLREDRRISKEQSATEKDKQRANGNSTDESALLIGFPSRGPASAGQPEKTSEQLDSANESPALTGHDASSLEQERRAEEGEVSVDESCSHVANGEQQQQAVQDQVQQQQQLVEPDWENRRQEKS